MKKRTSAHIASLTALIFAAMCCFCMCGCTPRVQTSSPATLAFINHVLRIKTPITVDSGADIEAGYVIYEFLTELERSDGDVAAGKDTLDGYKKEYDALRAQKDAEEAAARQAQLKKSFEKAVNALPDKDSVVLADRAAVDAAYAIYEQLDEASRADKRVGSAFVRLKAVEQAVASLEYLEYLERMREVADKFIEDVDKIGKVTLDSGSKITGLLRAYEDMDEDARTMPGMDAAKAKLDAAYATYAPMKDAADISELQGYVAQLYPVSKVTTASETVIVKAERLYKNMSDSAKADSRTVLAHDQLIAARSEFDILFAAEEAKRVAVFKAAADAIPSDLSGVDMSWYACLDDAENAYNALTYESKSLPDVVAAFNKWNAAQKAFDKLGYERVPMDDPQITFSDENSPNFVMIGYARTFTTLKEYFGVDGFDGLDQKAIFYVNVYSGGSRAGRFEVRFTDLLNGGLILRGNPTIVEGLKSIGINSGADLAFSVSFADREGKKVPSRESAVAAPQSRKYVW